MASRGEKTTKEGSHSSGSSGTSSINKSNKGDMTKKQKLEAGGGAESVPGWEFGPNYLQTMAKHLITSETQRDILIEKLNKLLTEADTDLDSVSTEERRTFYSEIIAAFTRHSETVQQLKDLNLQQQRLILGLASKCIKMQGDLPVDESCHVSIPCSDTEPLQSAVFLIGDREIDVSEIDA